MAVEIDKIKSLQIGVQGENIARNIQIDMTSWVEELNSYGITGYQFHILFQPYNDPNVYPMTSSYDAETKVLTWTITAEATLAPGVGYAEVRAQEETTGLVKKTRVIPTSVEKSVSGIESDPPEVQEAWVTIVLNARTAAENAAQDAEASADNSKKIIIVSDTQPQNEPYNKLWIRDHSEEEYQVPLYSEFVALAGDYNDTLVLLSGVKEALEGYDPQTAIGLIDAFLAGHSPFTSGGE